VTHAHKFAASGQAPNAPHPLRGIGLAASRSRQSLGRARALAFPLVVFAQARLVLLQLRLQFGEGLLATGADVFARACGVERSGWQREIQRERIFFAMGIFCKHTVQQNQIRLITLQQAIEFARVTFDFFFGGLVRLDIRYETFRGDYTRRKTLLHMR
jgi:hypothetical protein